MKNIYHKHRLKYETREDAEEMLQSKPLTNDRKYIQDQMKPIIECLDKHHVKKYSDFIKLLHDYGFMARDHFLFINSFVTYIKETKKQEIELPIDRQMKKANSGEKNLIVNRLVCEYPTEIHEFLQNYIRKFYPHIVHKNVLFEKFKSLIDNITNQENEETNIVVFDFPSSNIIDEDNLIDNDDDSIFDDYSNYFTCF